MRECDTGNKLVVQVAVEVDTYKIRDAHQDLAKIGDLSSSSDRIK